MHDFIVLKIATYGGLSTGVFRQLFASIPCFMASESIDRQSVSNYVLIDAGFRIYCGCAPQFYSLSTSATCRSRTFAAPQNRNFSTQATKRTGLAGKRYPFSRQPVHKTEEGQTNIVNVDGLKSMRGRSLKSIGANNAAAYIADLIQARTAEKKLGIKKVSPCRAN
eukprot:1158534-Pelagomonas_calceolata.AAC.12